MFPSLKLLVGAAALCGVFVQNASPFQPVVFVQNVLLVLKRQWMSRRIWKPASHSFHTLSI